MLCRSNKDAMRYSYFKNIVWVPYVWDKILKSRFRWFEHAREIIAYDKVYSRLKVTWVIVVQKEWVN